MDHELPACCPCGDAAISSHKPFAALVNDRQVVTHLQLGGTASAHPGQLPDDGSRDVPGRAARRHIQIGDARVGERTTQPGNRCPGREEAVQGGIVSAPVRLEKRRQLCAQLALCRGIRRHSGRRRRGGLRRGSQPGRLARYHQAAVGSVDGHPELHQLAVHAGQQGHHRMVRVLHGDAGDLLRLQPEVTRAIPAQLRVGAADRAGQVSRELLGTLVRSGGTEVQIHRTELDGVGLGEGGRKRRAPTAGRGGRTRRARSRSRCFVEDDRRDTPVTDDEQDHPQHRSQGPNEPSASTAIP